MSQRKMDSRSWTAISGSVNCNVVSAFMMMLTPVFVTGQEIPNDGFDPIADGLACTSNCKNYRAAFCCRVQ
jgi:hypothetical protein